MILHTYLSAKNEIEMVSSESLFIIFTVDHFLSTFCHELIIYITWGQLWGHLDHNIIWGFNFNLEILYLWSIENFDPLKLKVQN